MNTILGADKIFEFCEKIKNEASHMQNLYQSLVSKVKQIFFSCLIQKLKSNFTYVSLTINLFFESFNFLSFLNISS